MRAYIDTSVLLRIILGESGSLRQWRKIDVAITSELTRVEALRSIDRARILLALSDDALVERREAVLVALGGFHLARVDAEVLRRAAEPFPTLVRTLDAIHLATALLVQAEHDDLVFATHDRQLALAARAVGFTVIGTPAEPSPRRR